MQKDIELQWNLEAIKKHGWKAGEADTWLCKFKRGKT
jgi:hypothetical protein